MWLWRLVTVGHSPSDHAWFAGLSCTIRRVLLPSDPDNIDGAWQWLQSISAPTAAASGENEEFGAAVALEERQALIGCPDCGAAGKAFFYSTHTSGLYSELQSGPTLSVPGTPENGLGAGDRFGVAVALWNYRTAIVGSANKGVYWFWGDAGTAGAPASPAWSAGVKLTSADMIDGVVHDRIAISGSILAVGSSSSSSDRIHLWKPVDPSDLSAGWTEAPPVSPMTPGFGASLAVAGTVVFVGHPSFGTV